MPTRPESPDPSRSTTGADSAYAGLNFFQDWMKAASSALPHLTGATRAGTNHWSLPTLDPEELDKRIQDLKTVQFWLEQNARMIGMTIQTLEVQRMTLNTLRSMNMPMDAVRESLKANPLMREPTSDQATAPDTSPTDSPASGTEESTSANPLQWWNTLTSQFTHLAQQAVQAGQEAVAAATPHVPTPAADAPSQPARKRAPARKTSQRSASSARKPPKAPRD